MTAIPVTESDSAESMESMDIDDPESNNNRDAVHQGFQSFNKLIRFLPYSAELPDEANRDITAILHNLTRAVLCRDLQIAAQLCTSNLNSYFYLYGWRLTKEQHITLIKLFYELLTMETCPLNLVTDFAQAYSVLLKKPRLLTKEDITIPWRPLYETLDRCVYHRRYTLSQTASKNLETNLKFAIRTSNKYFPDSTLQEVIELAKPQLCPSISKMNDTLGVLSVMLPFFNRSTDAEFNEFMKFLLDIYNSWNNHPAWESSMFDILGSASSKMTGRIDWDPHLPVMYARLMKGLRLPVYFKQANNNLETQVIKGFTFSTAARWIIGTLGNRPEAIRHLKNFLETLETYYNPLNMGRWSVPLAMFLNDLVNIFTTRLKKERYGHKKDWWAETPEDRKLTNEDIDEFVQMTSELVLDFYLDLTTCGFILKNLACIRPDKIIPAVMEKYESMVDTVTEPRKYLTTMRWVTIVLLPMVSTRMEEDNYDGRRMAIPFAMSLLPAITCNDMGKTTSAFGVIHGLFNLIPLVDCSHLADTLEDETERAVCLDTACLQDFGLQFLDSVIALVESKTHEDTRMADHRTVVASGNIEDAYLEKLLWAVCHRLAVQSSTKIIKSLAKKIVSYAFSTTMETDVSGKLFAAVCQSFTTARPDVLLPKLLPQLCSSIQHLVTDDVLDEEEIDKTLQFHLLLFSYILETNGAELVKYKTDLELTLVAALKLNGKKAYHYSASAVLQLLRSLVLIYPLENRISEADFDDPNYLATKDWGMSMDKKNVHMKWHVPNVEELQWAKDIFLKVFIQFSEKYEGIGSVTERTEAFDKRLLKDMQVLGSALEAMNSLLPFWDQIPFKSTETVYQHVRFNYEFGLPKIDIVDPRTGENMKKTYFSIYCKIKTYLDTFKDDDTDAYVALIKGLDELVFANAGTERRFSTPVKHGSASLSNTLNPKKKFLRGGLITRIFDLHNKRQKYSSNSTFTKGHMIIMEKILELTVNRYARVRTFAQGRFCRMIDFFGSLVSRELTHLFIDKLKDGVPHDEYKGTLYTLLNCKKSPILINSWTQIRNLWVALLRSPFSEKNSIIKCMDSICKTLSQSFMFFPYEDKVTPKAMQYAKNLISAKELESLGTMTELDTSQNLSTIQTLMSELVDTAESGNVHWRQRLLCCNMLSVLIVDEVPMPKRMVQFFYDSLVSSSLEIRMSALSTISWFTVMFRRKLDTVTVDTRSGLKYAEGESMHTVFQYKSNPADEAIRCGKLEVTDENGQRLPSFYVHKMQYGYSALPTKLVMKLPPKDFADLSNQPDNIRPVLEVSQEYFQNVEFVKKLLDIFTQEEKSRKGSSGSKKTRIFVMLARNNGPESLKVTLDLVQALGKDKNEWKQRCAADIVSGILFGIKFWGEERIEKLWTTLQPIMNECLDSVTQETISYWSESMSIPSLNRDPNMMRFLIELMKERWLNSLATVDSTSVEAFKNMNFFDNTVANMHWRGAELYHEILVHVNKFFLVTPIPYVNVRDQLGRLMGDVFEWAGQQPVKFEVQLSPPFEPFVNLVFDGLTDLVPESAKYLANDKDSEANADVRKLLLKFKSILELIISACWESETTVPLELYRFIPFCCHFESYEPDQEVASLSACTLSGFARTLIHPSKVKFVLEQLTVAASSTSWKSRLCVVEFLKVFALLNTNVFISNAEFSEYIIGLVLNLLSDRKLEVRELASKVLSGFLHSLIVQKPMDLLKKFEVQADNFARRRRHLGKKTPKGALTSEELDGGHSAILGLCAFVETYPYDVPSFLPNILVILTTHLNDPQPIPATLRKCLSNFRRTHHDNWAIHKTKFSEDQLCILTDIFVSPCYYA